MSITYRGEKFAGYNKPKRTSKHPKKSHAVLAKEGSKVKLIRFGQKGVRGDKGNTAGQDLLQGNAGIKKGKMSAAYWASKLNGKKNIFSKW